MEILRVAQSKSKGFVTTSSALNGTPRSFSHLFKISTVPLSRAKIKEYIASLISSARDLGHIEISKARTLGAYNFRFVYV